MKRWLTQLKSDPADLGKRAKIVIKSKSRGKKIKDKCNPVEKWHFNKSFNARVNHDVEMIKSPSSTTIYTKAVQPVSTRDDNMSLDSETSFYSSSNDDSLINKTSSLVVGSEGGDKAHSSSSGLGTETIHKCMDIRRKKELEDTKKMADELIRDAERSCADILRPPPGKHDKDSDVSDDDDEFFHFTSHVDQSLVEKIERGGMLTLQSCFLKRKYYTAVINCRWSTKMECHT